MQLAIFKQEKCSQKAAKECVVIMVLLGSQQQQALGQLGPVTSLTLTPKG